MTAIDPVYAQWLQAETLWHVDADASIEALWGDASVKTERQTTLARKSDAVAQAARLRGFIPTGLVSDQLEAVGRFTQYIGRVVTVFADRLGYENGKNVFLLSADDNLATGLSTLVVLRRL